MGIHSSTSSGPGRMPGPGQNGHGMPRISPFSVALLGAVSVVSLAVTAAPATASQPLQRTVAAPCFDPGDAGAARGGGHVRGQDTRAVSLREQRAIDRRTRAILDRKAGRSSATAAAFAGASVPVYVHVMLDRAGNGDVTQTQINNQIAVLNKTYGGQESSAAANTGFTFTLAGVDRYKNTTWHRDGRSTTYRSKTRLGGANALNMWLVDFKYLGIATFPWDYASNPEIDGIRVQYSTLPGGSIANYNLGETATHEVGHWLGLYHTFQGGCTSPNDSVSDTPAQSSSTTGCPAGRDSCSLPGLDPIHNYMDYSYDSCYDQFTSGQSTRMGDMWTAYRT